MVDKLSSSLYLNILACVICVIASLSFFGFVLGNNHLSALGYSLGFSPMPRPFRELEKGSENMNVQFLVILKKDGINKNYSKEELLEFFSLHNKPHRAAIPFFTLSNYFIIVPDNIRRAGFEYICTSLGGDEMIAHIDYATRKYVYKVVCKS